MGKRAAVSLDWLRKGRMVEDLTILRNLIADSSAWKVETATLDEMLFEKTFSLRPLPEEAYSREAINKAISYESLKTSDEIPVEFLEPSNAEIRSQVKSLLPKNLNPQEKKILSYIFARFVVQDTPKDTDWSFVPEGLDSLSAALFTIYLVSRLIDAENPWLLPLWLYKVEEHRSNCLQTILYSLETDDEIDDIIDEIEKVQKSIEFVIPQDPLFQIVNKWVRTIRAVSKRQRPTVNETLQMISSEVVDEINSRKKSDLQRLTLTQWNIHALRPDGPSAMAHEPLLKMFRGNLNVLDFEPVLKMCKYLTKCERAGRPSASEIEQVIGTKRRMSHYTLQRLGMVLTERYMPTMTKLGLRYRFIFTQTQKPGVLSDGIIERMILAESSHVGCTVHIEPQKSDGPSDSLISNAVQMTVDSESISMRLDLYDVKNKNWNLGPWDEDSKSIRRTSGWLSRKTQDTKTSPTRLTNRQLDLLGPILAFRGLRTSRMWMLEKLGFPPRTARRYLRNMLDDKTLRLLYTPALEYCGLPEGMLVAAKFKEKETRNSFIDWMTARIPFTRVFTDKSCNMVAYLRLPPSKTTIPGARIRDILSMGSKRERITTQSFTARLRSFKTFQMTAFQRINVENNFRDPWEN